MPPGADSVRDSAPANSLIRKGNAHLHFDSKVTPRSCFKENVADIPDIGWLQSLAVLHHIFHL